MRWQSSSDGVTEAKTRNSRLPTLAGDTCAGTAASPRRQGTHEPALLRWQDKPVPRACTGSSVTSQAPSPTADPGGQDIPSLGL